jgi:UDP-glucuronate decarboxylase
MLELAKKIIGITNSKSPVVFKPLPLDDPRQRRPNIEMANSILKWSPNVSLDAGIEMTAKYFKLELGI